MAKKTAKKVDTITIPITETVSVVVPVLQVALAIHDGYGQLERGRLAAIVYPEGYPTTGPELLAWAREEEKS